MAKFIASFDVKPQYKLGDPIEIVFKLKNITDSDQAVLKWHTPLEEFKSGCITLTHNYKEIEYDGMHVKRADPSESDYIVVPAGDEISISVDLTHAYRIFELGIYEIQLSGLLGDTQEVAAKGSPLARARNLHQAEPIFAKQVEFEITAGAQSRKTVGETQREIEAQARAASKSVQGVAAAGTPLAPTIVGGSTSDQEVTKQAHYEMFNYLRSCMTDLNHSPASSNTHYQMVFGSYDVSRYNTLYGNFNSIYTALQNKTFTYSFNGSSCSSSTYAYTYKGSSTIYLCEMYKKAKFSGEDSKIGTLFHELSHAVAYTDDVIYGRGKCRTLAKDDPTKAIRNADSYEFFLESEFMYWTGNQKISDVSSISPESNYNPGMAVYNGKIYLIYKGAHSNNLYYATYDGSTWAGNKKISDVSSISPESNYNPGVAVYNGKLYLIYKGAHSNNLYYATFDGSTWAGNKKISDVSSISPESNYCPNLAVYNGVLYSVYKGAHSNTLYYLTFDGSTWSGNKKISDVSTISPESNYNPGMTVYNGLLYILYKGAHSNTLYYATYNASTWAGNVTISSVSDISPECNYCPRVATVGNFMYVPYKGAHSNTMYQTQLNWDSTLSRNFWTGNETIANNSDISPETNYEYSVVSFNGYNFTVYKGAHSNNLYFAKQIIAS